MFSDVVLEDRPWPQGHKFVSLVSALASGSGLGLDLEGPGLDLGLEGPGLGLDLEGPGLGLGLGGPGLGLVFGLWILFGFCP